MANGDQKHMEVDQSTARSGLPSTTSFDAKGNLSPLERLPKDCLWKLFEYTPELALHFRMMSQTMKGHLDSFTLDQDKIPFVSRLTVSDFRVEGSTKPLGEFNLMFDVVKEQTNLFYLRLCLKGYQKTFLKEKMRMSKVHKDLPAEYFDQRNGFDVSPNIEDPEIETDLELLNEWIGNRIGLILEERKVDELIIRGGFEGVPDTVPFLLQLASFVPSIHIYHFSNARKMFFGMDRDDSADVIVEMFKQKALNKLCIINQAHIRFLGTRTHILMNELTKMEKNVWLMCTSDGINNGFETDAYKNYVVKVDVPATPPQFGYRLGRGDMFLSIIHKTRLDELPL